MEQAVAALRERLAALDPGRARPELLDAVAVPAYGGESPLRGLASVAIQPPDRILVTPYDVGLLGAIERSIRRAHPDLGVTAGDGTVQVTLPRPSAERRSQLVRSARALAEEARIAVRLARQDALNDGRRREREGSLTAAQRGGRAKDVQRLTDEHVLQINDALDAAVKRLAHE